MNSNSSRLACTMALRYIVKKQSKLLVSIMVISHTVSFVKMVLSQTILPGDNVVDATVGGGMDTLFLSQQVGNTGCVFGFDIQEEALQKTRHRLAEEKVLQRVRLFLAGHETLTEHIPSEVHGTISATMFNLGYLPGSNKHIITHGTSTCKAIAAALGLMKKGGIISIVLYTGHEGGAEEAKMVEQFCATMAMDKARIMRCTMHNQPTAQTRILLLEKR